MFDDYEEAMRNADSASEAAESAWSERDEGERDGDDLALAAMAIEQRLRAICLLFETAMKMAGAAALGAKK